LLPLRLLRFRHRKQQQPEQHQQHCVRLVAGRERPARPVVHIQHGLLGSSTDWVLQGPARSLPMMLADAGESGTLWDIACVWWHCTCLD
jgi:hypothetical protein